jgi:hypothetical protein
MDCRRSAGVFCPHGLALAAYKRGFCAEIHVNREGPLFLDGVRNEDKKALLQLVHETFVEQLGETPVTTQIGWLTLEQIDQALRSGKIPIVLISNYRLDHCKTPHWVVIAAMDDQFVYIHNPDMEEKDGENALDKQYLPIARNNFDRMFQFGQSRLRAAVLIHKCV